MTPADDSRLPRVAPVRPAAGCPSFPNPEQVGRFPRQGEPCSAASVWRIVSHGLPVSFLSAANRRAIEQGVVRLPAFSGMILERPLGRGSPQVDLSLCVTLLDGGPKMLAGLDPRYLLPYTWLRHVAWRGVRTFCRRWLDEGTLWQHQVQSAWLEFDGPQLQGARPLPCFFVNTRAAPPSAVPEITATIIEPFFDPAEGVRVATSLERVWPHLSVHTVVEFVGVMSSRNPVTVRLCVSMPASELNRFLARIDTPLDDRSQRVADFSTRHAQTVVVHLDLGADFGANLGVEVKPADPSDWPRVLTDACTEGLCTAAEREDLLQIPRKTAICRAGRKLNDFEPFSFRSGRDWNDVGAFMYFRRINHLKLAWGAGRAVRAKAYIRIGYQWKLRAAG